MAKATVDNDTVFEAVVEKEDLEMWAEKIRGDSPRSATVLNTLLMHAKGYEEEFDFFVLRNKPAANVVMLLNQKDWSVMMLYCPEESESDLLHAISNTQLMPLEALLSFLFLPESLSGKVRQLVETKAAGKLEVIARDYFVYNTKLCAGDFVCPADYTVARVGDKASLLMEAVAECDYNYSDVDQFTRLRRVAPCATVYASAGEPRRKLNLSEKLSWNNSEGFSSDDEDVEDMDPLAWACINSYGQLGLVCTDKSELFLTPGAQGDFRKLEALVLGLATNACARRMVKEGFVVHSFLRTPDLDLSTVTGWRKQATTFDIVLCKAGTLIQP